MYDNLIQPRLTMNCYRPRFKALRKAGQLRPKLLAPALAKVSGDLNLIKMLLTVHADVVCANATSTNAPTSVVGQWRRRSEILHAGGHV